MSLNSDWAILAQLVSVRMVQINKMLTHFEEWKYAYLFLIKEYMNLKKIATWNNEFSPLYFTEWFQYFKYHQLLLQTLTLCVRVLIFRRIVPSSSSFVCERVCDIINYRSRNQNSLSANNYPVKVDEDIQHNH